MKKIFIFISLLICSPVLAQNYTATQGVGTTFGSKLVSAVNYPQIVFCDPTTPSQCAAVDSSGRLTSIIIGAASNNADGVATSSDNTKGINYNYIWNGATWDRTPGTAANGQNIQGSVASGVADSGNPVKTGCVFNSTLPTIANGQRADCQADASGNPRATIMGLSVAGSDGVSNGSVVVIGNQTTQSAAARPFQTGKWNFNGSTWDRDFTCPNTAIVNVTAAATTEIVALTSAQTIRICSVAVSMSLAGSVTFTSGTGTNCGTGTTALSGVMTLATGTPLVLSGMNGSILRPAVANAFCITAATGNVTGFVTYAKY